MKGKDKMKKTNNQTSKNHIKKQEKLMPQGFFHKIGITSFIDPNDQLLYRKVKKIVGSAVADDFYNKVVKNKDYRDGLHISFSHLGLTKLWYGNAIIETSRIASELETLSVPNDSNILDIGGGPGALAFWMAEIWHGSRVTVADKYSKVGRAWAEEIGNNQVIFVDSLLPDLKDIPDNTYNVIILSRVLSYLDWLKFPPHILAYSMEDYLSTPHGLELQKGFGKFVESIKRVMLPDGHIVIVLEWNDLNTLLTCKLFEQFGFYVDPEFFKPDRVSKYYSIIAFSQQVKGAIEYTFSEGMSAFLNFPQIPVSFTGTLAELIRKIFNDGATIAVMEVQTNENNLKMKQELIIKDALILLYQTDTYGRRISQIFPSVKMPEILKAIHDKSKLIESDDSIKMINKLLAA